MKAPRIGSTFDHLALAKRDPLESARFLAFLRRELAAGGAGLLGVAVEHEHDDGCCRREPWAATLVRLLTEAGGRQ